MRTVLLTSGALLGFAANSVLCRLALAEHTIDAVTFTSVRLAAGACMLFLIARLANRTAATPTGASWLSALSLFTYAAAFSLAYMRLPAGVGALVLFGLVQLTMVTSALWRGERLAGRQWLGFVIAIGGLLALMAPGLSAPDPIGAMLMAASGVAWGVYSIRGKRAANAMLATAGNFTRTLPLVFVLLLAPLGTRHAETRGIVLACISGSVTSGLAYSLWYAALRHLHSSQAAFLQLSVPVLTAVAGIVLLDESSTMHLVLAGSTILIGVALAVLPSRPRPLAGA